MCIFCKIINNEIPSYKIYEDEDVLAILDISQMTYGHTLVIPKTHVVNMFDVSEEVLINVTKVINKIVKSYKEKGINDLNIFTNSGTLAGQEVHHLHYHIIPRYNNDEFVIKHNSNKFNLEEVFTKMKI